MTTIDATPTLTTGTSHTAPTIARSLVGATAYLLVSFPLALAAFVVIATAITTGAALTVTLVGIPVVAGSLLGARSVERADAWLAHWLLGADAPTRPFDPANGGSGIVGGAWANLSRGSSWRALANQLIRPTVAGVTWVATVTALSVGAALTAAPAWYATGELTLPWGRVDNLPAALACVPLGIAVLALSVPALIWTARAQRGLCRLIAGAEA